MLAINNVEIFDGEKFLTDRTLHLQDGIIVGTAKKAAADIIMDGEGAILCPGFVDVHIHGSFGADVMDFGGVKKLAGCLPGVGTTSFCPTSVSHDEPATRQFLDEVQKAMQDQSGANVLGAHLEGPYLSVENRGAQDLHALCDPSKKHFDNMVKGYEDIIRRVSLAPELSGALELIDYLRQKGIAAAAAHTEASAIIMEKAISAGMAIATHAFNGYDPFHHRKENAICVILTNPGIVCEFIPDLHHLTKYAIRLLLASKGVKQAFICSDSCEAGAMPDGNYHLGRLPITVEKSVARLKSDGRLAGSTLSMLQGVQTLVSDVKVPLEVALRLATSNPARSLELDHEVGRIRPGGRADFVLLDQNLQLLKTFIQGRCVYPQ